MKKVLLTLLAVVLILGALGAAGMAGYRYGYYQGALSTSDADTPSFVPGFGYGPQRMPMHPFGFARGYGFDRDFGPGGFHMMDPGGWGFGFFSPLLFLVRLAFWGLVIWAIYMLVTRSGWRLTRTSQPVDAQSGPAETGSKE